MHTIKVHTEKFKVFIKMLTDNDFGGIRMIAPSLRVL